MVQQPELGLLAFLGVVSRAESSSAQARTRSWKAKRPGWASSSMWMSASSISISQATCGAWPAVAAALCTVTCGPGCRASSRKNLARSAGSEA